MNKALFLDRDGILNKVVIRDSVVSSARSLGEFELILDSEALLRAAKQKCYLVIVITNQPDVNRGLLDPEDLRAMHTLLMKELPIDHIELCTSSDDADFRRKPNPGMILDAANKLEVDLAASFLVGDGEKDIIAGKRAGIKTILLQTPYNSQIHGIGDFNCSSLDEVTKLL